MGMRYGVCTSRTRGLRPCGEVVTDLMPRRSSEILLGLLCVDFELGSCRGALARDMLLVSFRTFPHMLLAGLPADSISVEGRSWSSSTSWPVAGDSADLIDSDDEPAASVAVSRSPCEPAARADDPAVRAALSKLPCEPSAKAKETAARVALSWSPCQ